MLKFLATSVALAAFAGLGGSVAHGTVSDATLAALDPTRDGRFACRGIDVSGAVLAQRLKLAERFAGDRAPVAAAATDLYSAMPASDLPVAGVDPLARKYFEQGLALAYGFNHKAAIRSFRRAQEIAPACALCWWGEALANGPNINAGMDDAGNQAALAALEKAKALAPKSPALVQDLIAAQAARYSAAPGSDRAALDGAYADAMLAVAGRYPQSDDIAIFAAEAAMNTTPWNYFDPETGAARPRIGDAVALAEKVIARSPGHAQASHVYIHLLEAKDPKAAEAAADRLRQTRAPVLGHLVHMPAHIYFRLGRWQDSIAVNVDAAKADEEYLALAGDDGIYRYGYYPHNVHFIVTSAQMMGDVGLVMSQTSRLASLLSVEAAALCRGSRRSMPRRPSRSRNTRRPRRRSR